MLFHDDNRECVLMSRADISVAQWLGLTPPQVVKDTLHLPDAVIASLPKYKQYLVPGSTNATETNFTVAA